MTRVISAFFIILGIACSGDDGDGGDPDAGISPACQEATAHSDLAWIQDNILTPNCAAFGSCHLAPATIANGLVLQSGMSETALVGVASQEDVRYELVVPGDANSSYLLLIMNRNPDALPVTVNRSMPVGDPSFCDEKKEAVARWVNSL